MNKDVTPFLGVRVDPNAMLQYVHTLLTTPTRAAEQWGKDSASAKAAQMRWRALNLAFGDARVSPWTSPRHLDQLHVPAALIAAAAVARLTMAEDEVVFDIPTLLDATLEMCEPVGHA